MSNKNTDKFNFFVPLEIVKGKTSGSTHEMLIRGIASSETEDSDGETLIPAGYDLTPFLQSGFLNYNHQAIKDPEAIIGEPTKAEIINGGKDLYIEGFLYPNSAAARKVYELAGVLEKNSPTRRLGFSIEGKALERDPFNKKRVLKARITGVAITANPKNSNTLMSIIKGEYSEPFVENNEEEDEEIDKAMTAAAGEGVTQVEHVEGGEKKLKEALNNNTLTKGQVYSAIVAKYGDMIGTNAEQAKNIYAFVEHVNHMTMNSNQNVIEDALTKAFDLLDNAIVKGKDEPALKEEEVPADAVDNPDGLTPDEAAAVSSDEPEVEEETAAPAEEAPVEEKEAKAPVSAPTKVEKSEEADLIKGEDVKATKEFVVSQSVVDICVDKGIITPIQAAAIVAEWSELGQNGAISAEGLAPDTMSVSDADKNLAPGANGNGVKKSEDFDLLKGEVTQLGVQQRAIAEIVTNRLGSLGELIKGFNEQLDLMKSEKNDLIKSHQNELQVAQEQNNLLASKVQDLEKGFNEFLRTPQPMRSITTPTQVASRFPEETLNKSQDAGMTQLSLSNPGHMKQLENLLVNEVELIKGQGGSDLGLSDAAFELSIAHTLEPTTLNRIQKTLQQHKVQVVQ